MIIEMYLLSKGERNACFIKWLLTPDLIRGMWSGKPSSAKTYADASATMQKAKLHAATLKNKGKMPAIVDFVKSGSRFTVLVPRENLKLNFVLGGIR
jgi:staphylococcal nuclease domain-containing protein 1